MDMKVILMINAFKFPVVLQILALTNLPPPPLLVRWGVGVSSISHPNRKSAKEKEIC